LTLRHFLDLDEIDPQTLRHLLSEAHRRKAGRAGLKKGVPDGDKLLDGQVLAMIFEKASTRTRVSFEIAMRQLGGSALMMAAGDTQLGRGETIEDTAHVLSRMVDGVMLRTNRHETLTGFAAAASIPVINGLTDRSHPCQILADLMTLEERGINLEGARIAWIGDGNNVCTSFIHAAPAFGFQLAIASPVIYGPDKEAIARARAAGGDIVLTDDAHEAAAGADSVVADTWVSMGDTDTRERMQALAPYQVDSALMRRAKPGAVFLHCLPAHRGEEVTADVIDGPQSAVFQEAENRIHAQKAVLAWCMGGTGVGG
jgi:ornithine carbamoyltransferase